jgi:signal transduction histidine kinase
LVLLVLGYFYEDPFGIRKTILISLILIYTVFISFQMIAKKRIVQLTLIMLSVIVLIIIEINSKYAIDYFFHSMYILMLMYVVIHYDKKAGLILSIILTLGSIVKFAELLTIQMSPANLAMFVFFFTVQMLVLLVAIFAKVYREENAKTKQLYEELLETHKQMKKYSNEIKQLTMVEERSKIARDLHDTLGHDMTGLIMQMEMTTRFFSANDTEQGIATLEKAKKSARESLAKVRQILNTLKNENEIEWTNTSLYELAEDFANKTETEIHCEIIGDKSVRPDVGITIYRIIQEGLTNAIRHGKATKVKIIITYKDQEVLFYIEDNGSGCSEVIKGNGLNGMLERVALLQGKISFENTKGFLITGSLPYDREELK